MSYFPLLSFCIDCLFVDIGGLLSGLRCPHKQNAKKKKGAKKPGGTYILRYCGPVGVDYYHPTASLWGLGPGSGLHLRGSGRPFAGSVRTTL